MKQSDYFMLTALQFKESLDYVNSISRMYYAVFHVMKEGLKVNRNGHKDIRKLYVTSYGITMAEGLQIVIWQRLREDADYNKTNQEINRGSVEILSALDLMRLFILNQQILQNSRGNIGDDYSGESSSLNVF